MVRIIETQTETVEIHTVGYKEQRDAIVVSAVRLAEAADLDVEWFTRRAGIHDDELVLTFSAKAVREVRAATEAQVTAVMDYIEDHGALPLLCEHHWVTDSCETCAAVSA